MWTLSSNMRCRNRSTYLKPNDHWYRCSNVGRRHCESNRHTNDERPHEHADDYTGDECTNGKSNGSTHYGSHNSTANSAADWSTDV